VCRFEKAIETFCATSISQQVSALKEYNLSQSGFVGSVGLQLGANFTPVKDQRDAST